MQNFNDFNLILASLEDVVLNGESLGGLVSNVFSFWVCDFGFHPGHG